MKYILSGNPVPLARSRYANHKLYDSQKNIKLIMAIDLQRQHAQRPIFLKPLKLTVTFFMPISKSMSKQKNDPPFHYYKPDLDNLIKFIADISNGIIFKDDSIIASISAKKVYDINPRTEFSFKELL